MARAGSVATFRSRKAASDTVKATASASAARKKIYFSMGSLLGDGRRRSYPSPVLRSLPACVLQTREPIGIEREIQFRRDQVICRVGKKGRPIGLVGDAADRLRVKLAAL